MHSTEIVVAHGFQAGGRTSTVQPVDSAPSRGRGTGRLRSVTSWLLRRRAWEPGRPLDEAVAPSRRELPVPFC